MIGNRLAGQNLSSRGREQRRSARNRVFLMGEISIGDRTRRMLCKVIDMSATGARLSISAEQRNAQSAGPEVRNRIGLYLDRCMTNVECQVVWSGETEVGVRFCTPFQRLARAH